MADVRSELIFVLLGEHFGSIPARVGEFLEKNGPSTLREITTKIQISPKMIKRCLRVLFHHDLVEVVLKRVDTIHYSINFEHVCQIIRYPKYVSVAINEAEESQAELVEYVMGEVLKEGQTTIRKLVSNMPEPSPTNIKRLENVFVFLVKKDFLCISNNFSRQTFIQHFLKPQNYSDDVNESYVRALFEDLRNNQDSTEERPAKRRKRSLSVDDVFWMLNFKVMNLCLRDDLIMEAVKRRYKDDRLALIVQAMLASGIKQSIEGEQSLKRISYLDILSNIKGSLSKQDVTLCLQYLMEIPQPLITTDDDDLSGGPYTLRMEQILDKMVEATLSDIVEQKYGSKSARIFKIILSHRLMRPKKIEDLAMLASKECRDIIFNLVKTGFVKTNYYSKVNEYLPTKTYFVYSVDIPAVCRMVLGICHKTIFNAVRRRNYEHDHHKSLIEKKQHIDNLIEQLRQEEDSVQQIEDLKNAFTSHENDLLASVEKSIRKCHVAEIETDETAFILKCRLRLL